MPSLGLTCPHIRPPYQTDKKLLSTLQHAEVLWFMEASTTKRQLVLSWHSLRCANHPFYACALDSLQLRFKPLLSLTSATSCP